MRVWPQGKEPNLTLGSVGLALASGSEDLCPDPAPVVTCQVTKVSPSPSPEPQFPYQSERVTLGDLFLEFSQEIFLSTGLGLLSPFLPSWSPQVMRSESWQSGRDGLCGQSDLGEHWLSHCGQCLHLSLSLFLKCYYIMYCFFRGTGL